ncbi:MAG: histidine kinase [Actinomycetaceae bacterium]|nr:histidine kinase [Actinomycetaceae bacterium]
MNTQHPDDVLPAREASITKVMTSLSDADSSRCADSGAGVQEDGIQGAPAQNPHAIPSEGPAQVASPSSRKKHIPTRLKNRFIALGFSSPFLVFFIFPIMGLVQAEVHGIEWWSTLLHLVMYAIIYITSWLLFDVSPVRRHPQVSLLVIFAIMIALQMSMVIFGGFNSIYMLCYIVAMVFLMPHSWVMGSMLVLIGVAFLEWLTWWNNPAAFIPFIVIIANAIAIWRIAEEMYRDRMKEQRHLEQVQAEKDRQRLQISADLHDILGQQLTAIAVKSELVSNIVSSFLQEEVFADSFPGEQKKSGELTGEKNARPLLRHDVTDRQFTGKHQEESQAQKQKISVLQERALLAEKEAQAVAQLTRQALADVRKVVSGTREMSLEQELLDAQNLLETIGVDMRVNWLVRAKDIEPAGIIERFGPYVVREGAANIVHHGRAVSDVHISIDAERLTMTDNGKHRGVEQGRRQGSGLTGLASRVDGYAVVSWGPVGSSRGWHVTLSELHNGCVGDVGKAENSHDGNATPSVDIVAP